MTDVFISYARRDSEEFAQRLTGALENAELDVWVDLEDIPAASDWQRDLSEGVLASEYVCFVISPASVASEHCLDELNQAIDRHKRLIPILHQEVADDQVPEPLRRLNWIPQRGLFEDDFERHVQTTVAAVRTDLDRLREHTRWEQRASEWEARGRDASLLARGSEMREAEDWLAAQAKSEPQPTARQIEFVSASRRASSRRQRSILGISLLALAISVVLGITALIARNDARDKADLARSNELSASAMANLDSDPELSLMLAVKAAEIKPTERSEQALATAVSASSVRAQIEVDDKPFMARESPDGREVVVATNSGADLYGPDGQHLVHLEGDGGIYDTVFTQDSRFVLTAGEDKEIRRYELPSGDLVDTIKTPTFVSSIAVSQGSALIAATTTKGDVELYRFDGGHYGTLPAGKEGIITVDFAAHGPALVSAGFDGSAIVWDAATGERIGTLSGKSARFRDADVTDDGTIAVTVDQRGVAREWNVDDQSPMGPPLNHLVSQGRVKSVDLSPDQSSVAMGMADGRARVVDLDTRETVGTYGGHHGALRQAEFGADGQALVTTGLGDGLARVFDVSSLDRTIPTSSRPGALALSPDGNLLAVAELDGEMELFDAHSGARRQRFQFDSAGALRAIAFSPDGKRLALGGDDGSVRVWDVAGKHLVGHPLHNGDSVRGVAFDPSGTRLVTGSEDGHARVWDLASGQGSPVLNASYTYATDWSSNDRLAIVAQDNRHFYVDVLNADTSEPVTRLEQSSAVTAQFTSDGSRVVTAGTDGSARVWDAETGDVVARFADQTTAVTSATFVPGDERAVTTAQGGTTVWSSSSGLRLDFVDGPAADVVAATDGKLIIGRSDDNAVEVHDCEPCHLDGAGLLDLARSRITREPTPQEAELYGLD